jgi:hypothetical protein
MILSRGAGAPFMAEIAKPFFWPVVMVYLDWPSGEVWYHTGRGTITWNGNDWIGAGDFAEVSIPEEAPGMAATNALCRVIGTFDQIEDAANEEVKNRPGAIYFGVTTTRAGNVLVGDPVNVFYGSMDGTMTEVGEDGGRQIYSLQLTIGSGPSARTGATITHSQEDQAYRFPGDTWGRHTQFAIPNARTLY